MIHYSLLCYTEHTSLAHWPTLPDTALTPLCPSFDPSHTFACLCLLPTIIGLFDLVTLFQSERITGKSECPPCICPSCGRVFKPDAGQWAVRAAADNMVSGPCMTTWGVKIVARQLRVKCIALCTIIISMCKKKKLLKRVQCCKKWLENITHWDST